MSFLHPGLLLFLVILPFILLGAILSFRRQKNTWKKMISPRLESQLVQRSSTSRRWAALALGLLGCSLLLIALARPYRGETTITEQISTRNILIAIDTSRSMLVQDGAPDRMATAKAMAIEVLDAFPNDRVGIIAFSGSSVLMAPLSIDHGAVQETISQIDTNVIPSGGSDLRSAVTTALKAFQKTGQKANALIIISDGEDHSTSTELAAAEIRETRTIVCSIGVGTSEGGFIPDRNYRDGKFRDRHGQTVLSRLSSEGLDTLARAGRGSYTAASSGSTSVIGSALDSLKRDEQEGRETTIPNEYFHWFLIPSILLLIASVIVQSNFLTRPQNQPKKSLPQPPPITTATASILILSLCLLPSLPAATLLEQAETSYTDENYDKALALFSKALEGSKGEERRAIQFSIGCAAYKLKQWDAANKHLSSALLTDNNKLREQAHYNLGNALFNTSWKYYQPEIDPSLTQEEQQEALQQLVDLEKAIASIEDSIGHYQASLDISPNNKEATHNLTEAKKLLEELQELLKKQEQQQQQEQQQGEQQRDQEDQQSQSDQQNQGENGDQDQQNGNQPNENQDQEQGGGEGDQQEDQQGGNNEGETSQEDQQSNSDQNDSQASNSQLGDSERQDGETEEAYAARILKENSDAETRPVQRRLLRSRRPEKDW